MKKYIQFTAAILIVLLISSCANKKIAPEEVTLENTWTLNELSGFEHSLDGAKGKPELKFQLSDSTYSGHSGCNSFQGKMKLTNHGLALLPGLMTKMYCDDNGLESAYMKAIQSVTSYSIEAGKLVLSGNKSGVKVVFSVKE